MKTVEFFFDFGSPYSYLASTQVEAVAERAGSRLIWRPFLLGAVFQETGNTSPVLNPCKARYMVKDLLDWTRRYGLPDLTLPTPFPGNSLLSCRLALVAQEQGKLPPFAHSLYRQIFAHGEDRSDRGVLARVLTGVELDPEFCFRRAEEAEIKAAAAKGIVKAPSAQDPDEGEK